ncbi:MAG TPA: hypothetical protein VF559_00415 [Caulobacteraceae bacterium]
MTGAAVLALALAAAAAPLTASAAELVVDGAMARIAVVPEARSDLRVEVTPGSNPMLAVQVRKVGDRVLLHSDLVVRSCTGDSDKDGRWRDMRVRFRNGAQADMAEAPVITVHAPRDLNISGHGPVSGVVGAARNLSLRYDGCGNWRLDDIAGRLDAQASRGASVRAANVGTGVFRTDSGGAVSAESVADLDLDARNGGAISVARASGRARLNAQAGGAISVSGGRTRDLQVVAESGAAVSYGGRAGAVNASAHGGAVVSIAQADGPVTRSSGGGSILSIGGRNR